MATVTPSDGVGIVSWGSTDIAGTYLRGESLNPDSTAGWVSVL